MKILLGGQCKSYTRAGFYLWGFGGGAAKVQQNGRISAAPAQRFHGMGIAVVSVGQERRLVDPPSQWLLG